MNPKRKSIYIFLIAVLLAGLVIYYMGSSATNNNPGVKENSRIIETIGIGTIGEDAASSIELFQPTANYIAEKLSNNGTVYRGKVVVARTVENISDLLKEQKLDLYIDCPMTTAMVANKSKSVPFLRRWKDGVKQYHSIFMVRKNSSISTLADLSGKTLVCEHPASTSGYLLPKAFLHQKGYLLNQSPGENSIRYVFSGNDNNTPFWVIEGKADAGVISDTGFQRLPESLKNQLKIIDRTPDLPRYVVSHRSNLDPFMVEKIRQVLLDMDKDPVGIDIMNNFENTKKYDDLTRDEIADINKMYNSLE